MELYQELCSRKLLKKCWKSIYASKPTNSKPQCRDINGRTVEGFNRNAEQFLDDIYESLCDNKFQFSSLKVIKVPKEEKGKYRAITIATVRDKIVQRAILSIVAPIVYEQISQKVNFSGARKSIWRKGKGDKKNSPHVKSVKRIIEKLKDKEFWVYESDIQSFYDSIPKRFLLSKLTAMLPDKSLNKLLRQVIYFQIGNTESLREFRELGIVLPTRQKGIAQGSILSPIFSNIYLANFDMRMSEFCGNSLIRYVDDFIIFDATDKGVRRKGAYARKLLRDEKLRLKASKTSVTNLRSGSIKFLGLRINRDKITAKKRPKEIRRKFQNEVLNLSLYKTQTRKVKKGSGMVEVAVSAVEQINEKIIGWGEYYDLFHVSEAFNQVNECILLCKRRDKRLGGLKELSFESSKTFIKESDWRKLFE